MRVLVVMNTIDAGGAETFIMKLFRCVKKKGVIFDFLINKPNSDFYEHEIKQLGGNIFRGFSKSKNPIKCFNFIYRTVRNEHYENVFCIATHPIGCIDILFARLGGARNILTRSTIASNYSLKLRVLAPLFRPLIKALSTYYLAPSKEAGEWLFGKLSTSKEHVIILNNGLKVTDYIFSQIERERVREELQLSDKFVIGHVGRFSRQKNHKKLLEIFYEIHSQNPNAVLVLVGDGELKKEIEQQSQKMGLGSCVQFLGIRRDVPSLLNAFDIFVFPSLYEGLPNTIIETQASSLPAVIADTISCEVLITQYVKMLSLTASAKEWIRTINIMSKLERKDMSREICEAGFSIDNTTDNFMKLLTK